MGRLGVARHFEGVFDIAEAAYVPKPDISAYRALVARHGIDPARAIMLDDMPRNLAPAAELGMTTVWVKTDVSWAQPAEQTDYIHHTTENLADWLHADEQGRDMNKTELQHVIDAAWERRTEINPGTEGHVLDAVHAALDGLDRGEFRVAEKRDGKWETNQWLKKAVLLSFRLMNSS